MITKSADQPHVIKQKKPAINRLLICMCLTASLVLPMGCQKQEKGAALPPPVVEVADVVQKDIPIYHEWIGSADGYINATIRAQVTGYLIKQNYTEGDFVKKNQILFEIDPRTFQAAVDQAQGVLAQQQALWEVAKANLKRVKPLAEKNAVSQKDLDDAVGNELSTRAQVLSAQASLDKANLDLSFTKIISPVDGIAGIAKAQIGNLVGPNSAQELTTVSTLDPIKVYVSVSEQEYLRAVEGKKTLEPQVKNIEMVLADGSTYPYKGEFAIADRQVDVRTGSIKVAALFKNPGNIIRPGQFSRVRAIVRMQKNAVLVPERAITELQGSYQVAVVTPENKIDIRAVRAGYRFENSRVIEQGLKPGEKVVVEGTQKVRQGMPVNPKAYSPGTEGKAEASQSRSAVKPEAPAKTEKR